MGKPESKGQIAATYVISDYSQGSSSTNHAMSIKDVILAYKDNFGETSYFVLWGGDISCAGGTGTSSYYISEVGKYRDTNPFLVIQRDVFSFLDEFS